MPMRIGFVLLAVFLAASPLVRASDRSADRRPVVIDLPAEELNKLNPEDRAMLLQVTQDLARRLWTWQSFPVEVPSTSFDGGAEIISLSNFMKAPNDEEVRAIGNQHLRLSPEQVKDIHETGMFKVPSEKFPGQFHVWKVNLIFQKGRENIQISWKKSLDSAHDQIFVSIPRRLVGNDPLSIRRGMDNIQRGLTEILSLLVGLRAEQPTYTPAALQRWIDGELQRRKGEGDSDRDEKIRNVLTKLESQILDVNNQANQSRWQAIVAELVNEGLRDSDLVETANARLEQELKAKFFQAIRHSSELTTIELGLGEKLYRVGMVLAMVQKAEDMVDREARQREVGIRAGLVAQHSIQAHDEDWLNSEVARRVGQWQSLMLWTAYSQVVAEARGKGFTAEADELEKDLQFFRKRLAPEVKEMKKETSPVVTKTWDLQIWRKAKWKVEKTKDGYRLVQTRAMSVSSDELFWRLKAIGGHTAWAFNNGLYNLLVRNLWNGPLGLRSLFSPTPFQYRWTVDKNGDIVLSEKTHDTLVSRIGATRAYGDRVLADFENRPNTGFFGKGFERFLLFFKVDLGLKLVVPAFVGLGQTLLSTGNAVGSAALTAASVVWAPASSLLVYGSNAVLFSDLTEARSGSRRWYRSFQFGRFFPLVRSSVTTVGGGLEVVGSAASATIAHPAIAGVEVGSGWVVKKTRATWDGLWLKAIQRLGRVPGGDTWIALRVSGPGLDKNYFFSLAPTIALGGVLAALEKAQLAQAKMSQAHTISQPSREATEILKTFAILFGDVPLRSNSPALADLTKNEQELLKSLESAFEASLRQVDSWSVLPVHAVNHIRLTPEGLAELRLKTKSLIEAFHSQGKLSLWKVHNVTNGDWPALTDRVLAGVFGENILTALSEEPGFVIDLRAPDLESWVDGLVHGYTPNFEPIVVDVTERERKASASVGQPKVKVVSAQQICEGLLAGPTAWRKLVVSE